MARPPDSRHKSIERKVQKAKRLIDSGVPKMAAYRMAGITSATYYFRNSQADISEFGVALRVAQQNAQAQ
jgi:adenine deaminase